MKTTHLIKSAILSEKSYSLMDKGTYTFLVSKSASKNQIKKAVENQFDVNVFTVKVLQKQAKTKRISGTRKTTVVGSGKKALVTLQKGQSIALFSTKSEKSKSKKADAKAESKLDKKQEKKKGLLSRLRKSKDAKEDK